MTAPGTSETHGYHDLKSVRGGNPDIERTSPNDRL
jgi:hypothetical protein